MIILACGASVPPLSAASSLEDRLSALEAEVASLRLENQTLRQDLDLAADAAPAPVAVTVVPNGREAALSVRGLLQAQAEFGDRTDSRGQNADRFRLRRVRLGVDGHFAEHLGFRVEGEYAGSSASLTDGYMEWTRFPAALIRAGQFKTPFGYEFIALDPRLYTIERTLGSDRLTLNRQVGVQASGTMLEKRLTYTIGTFNGNGANVSTNDNDHFNTIGRLAATAWSGRLADQPARWTLGTNGYTSSDTSLSLPGDFGFTGNRFTGRREGWGVDSQFVLGPLELWTEYLSVDFDPADGSEAATTADAWYLQAACYVVPRSVQLMARFDTFDPRNLRADDETDTWTFGLNWYLKGNDLKLQFNYVTSQTGGTSPDQLLLRSQVIF